MACAGGELQCVAGGNRGKHTATLPPCRWKHTATLARDARLFGDCCSVLQCVSTCARHRAGISLPLSRLLYEFRARHLPDCFEFVRETRTANEREAGRVASRACPPPSGELHMTPSRLSRTCDICICTRQSCARESCLTYIYVYVRDSHMYVCERVTCEIVMSHITYVYVRDELQSCLL